MNVKVKSKKKEEKKKLIEEEDADLLLFLKNKNTHPRDDRIVMMPGHKYKVDDALFISVSEFSESFFPGFDQEAKIKELEEKNAFNDPLQSKYFKKTPEQLRMEWKTNGETASAIGTSMHEAIEKFYNLLAKNNFEVTEEIYSKVLI